MHSASTILIRAPRDKVFAMVSQLLRWPEFLPHYRFVREIVEDRSKNKPLSSKVLYLHMSAEGGWFPVAWKARYHSNAETLELHFEHVAAFTKGMRVVWTLTPTPEGTQVEILHELRFRVGALSWLMEPVLQFGFIEPVARKTLARFKQLLEAQA